MLLSSLILNIYVDVGVSDSDILDGVFIYVGVFICVGVINYEFSEKGEKMTSVEEEGDGKSNPGPGDAFQSKDLPMNCLPVYVYAVLSQSSCYPN
ncbi:MAG: hypothetical protein EZS28_048711 [Streblomastix strix]|uniref:Uncharacterized protein n=1 Tax=Streblomastix strix TaxID=222440 RepID=A0A5J4TCW8_9EUKA|nr:MAG: hypothetical protein EZS28_048711 [Streblomastix strix]